jgi:hypothetical protein
MKAKITTEKERLKIAKDKLAEKEEYYEEYKKRFIEMHGN